MGLLRRIVDHPEDRRVARVRFRDGRSDRCIGLRPTRFRVAAATHGGRAWTTGVGTAVALDLGCGWLHSADRNPWHAIAVAQGRTIDKTPPPWRRLSRRAFPSILQAAPYRPPLPRPRSAWPSPACALRSRRPSSRCDGRGCRNPRDKPRWEREIGVPECPARGAGYGPAWNVDPSTACRAYRLETNCPLSWMTSRSTCMPYCS